jgi:hypothetical protein
MPIRPFLAGQAFDPQTITKTSAAYERGMPHFLLNKARQASL